MNIKKIFLPLLWSIIQLTTIYCYPKTLSPESIRIFNSLSQIEQYAQTLPEYPMPTNDNWHNPDFTSTIQMLIPNCMSNLLARWSIYQPSWSIYAFHTLLETVVNMRLSSGYKNSFIQKMYLKPGSSIIAFGGLYGAFHSLVRDLKYLKQKEIINDELRIIKPDSIIVFMGNIVSFSPYILETLTTILRLMIMNPDTVFYIKGQQETDDTWKQDGLKTELLIRASYYKNGDIPLHTLINNLFNTLPHALYLVADQTSSQVDVVRISSSALNQKINENQFAQFFTNPKEQIAQINQKTALPQVNVNVAAYIESSPEEKEKHRATHGLALVAREKKAPIWDVFSSPTGANRALYQFFYDSFIGISTSLLLKDWTIALYEQDVRDKKGIKPFIITNLLSGQEFINKEIQERLTKKLHTEIEQFETRIQTVDDELSTLEKEKIEAVPPKAPAEVAPTDEEIVDKEIRFGTSMDLTNGISDICQQSLAGIEMAFHHQNKKGGINGKNITLKVLNDEYNPRRALNNVQKLLDEYKINKLIDPSGTPTLAAFFKLVEQGKILVLFTTSGSHIFRNPAYKYIIHYRSSYIREGEALARYAIETLGAKKIGLIYQSDVPSIEGTVAYFKRVGFNNWFDVIYKRDDISMDQQVNLINKENPDTLIFLSIATAAIDIIRQYGTAQIGTKHLLGWSDLGSDLFQKFIKQQDLRFITSNGVPSPLHSQLPIVKEFRRLADMHNIAKGAFALEGFICGSIAIEILKQIKGNITKEKIIEIAEQFNNFDLGGITLSFNWETRELCPIIWLDTGIGEWTAIRFEVPALPTEKKLEKIAKEPSVIEK